jgi:hypothetical protein
VAWGVSLEFKPQYCKKKKKEEEEEEGPHQMQPLSLGLATITPGSQSISLHRH